MNAPEEHKPFPLSEKRRARNMRIAASGGYRSLSGASRGFWLAPTKDRKIILEMRQARRERAEAGQRTPR